MTAAAAGWSARANAGPMTADDRRRAVLHRLEWLVDEVGALERRLDRAESSLRRNAAQAAQPGKRGAA